MKVITLVAFLITVTHSDTFFRKDYTFKNNLEAFYKFHATRTNFTEAVTICSGEGAELFFPGSVNEANTVLKTFVSDDETIWVGAHDLYVEGSFVTLDGSPVESVYSNWHDHEPNDYEGDEDCVVLDENAALNDIPCHHTRRFVCKRNSTNLTQNSICETHDIAYQYHIDVDGCYKIHREAKNWNQAFRVCHLEGSQLAVINSVTEAEVLKSVLARYPSNILYGNVNKDSIHVGFSDVVVHGSYRTVEGKPLSESGYDKWAYNQPDNADGNEHCGGMFRDGTLNDVNCDTRAMFICERKLGGNKATTTIDVRTTKGTGSRPGHIVALPDA